MAATLTPPTRPFLSERERLRRRRDRHARLATDGVMTELAFELRARERRDAVSVAPERAREAQRGRRAHADTSGGTATSSRPSASAARWRSISSLVA
jgi:hypothetical protein